MGLYSLPLFSLGLSYGCRRLDRPCYNCHDSVAKHTRLQMTLQLTSTNLQLSTTLVTSKTYTDAGGQTVFPLADRLPLQNTSLRFESFVCVCGWGCLSVSVIMCSYLWVLQCVYVSVVVCSYLSVVVCACLECNLVVSVFLNKFMQC